MAVSLDVAFIVASDHAKHHRGNLDEACSNSRSELCRPYRARIYFCLTHPSGFAGARLGVG